MNTPSDRSALSTENHLVKLLKQIRDDSNLWKSKGPSGADMYQGLPPFVRLIDEALNKSSSIETSKVEGLSETKSAEEPKCTLRDEDLLARCDEWVHKLARSGGQDWCLQVPVNFNRDPDMLFLELISRHIARLHEVKRLEGHVLMLKDIISALKAEAQFKSPSVVEQKQFTIEDLKEAFEAGRIADHWSEEKGWSNEYTFDGWLTRKSQPL